MGAAWYFTKYLVGGGGTACDEKMDPIGSKILIKEGSKRSQKNEKGIQQN